MVLSQTQQSKGKKISQIPCRKSNSAHNFLLAGWWRHITSVLCSAASLLDGSVTPMAGRKVSGLARFGASSVVRLCRLHKIRTCSSAPESLLESASASSTPSFRRGSASWPRLTPEALTSHLSSSRIVSVCAQRNFILADKARRWYHSGVLDQLCCELYQPP